jgi:hypothetical protein
MTLRQSTSSRSKANLLFALIAFSLLCGCSSSTAFVSNKFDPVTAVTITYSQAPMVFYRDESGRAAYARDYVHLGPLEVNRSGTYRYYIWLGIWNTMQDATTADSRDGFESVVVFADEEPLQLEISGWTPAAIGASEPVYVKPVASAADAYYEVTVDQLRIIAEAKDVRIQSVGPQRRFYEPWDDHAGAKASLAEFLGLSVY